MDLTFSTQFPNIAIATVVVIDSDLKFVANHS